MYKAGTIGTVADKTAYGFVKGYERDNNMNLRNAEIDRLAKGSTGVKRSTGQHPGGIIVIPDYMDVYDFTPIQYPADDQNADWKTTHFDFHSIHDNVLKLDILGHDDPTVIRMLQDLSGIDPKTIPTDDPEVMRIFSGPQVLGVEPDQIHSKTGRLGAPDGAAPRRGPQRSAADVRRSRGRPGLDRGDREEGGHAAPLVRRQALSPPLPRVRPARVRQPRSTVRPSRSR